VRFSDTRYVGFTWEPRQRIAEAPQPRAVPVALHPAASVDTDAVIVTVAGMQFNVRRGFSLAQDADGVITINAAGPGQMSLRPMPRPKKIAKRVRPAALPVAATATAGDAPQQ